MRKKISDFNKKIANFFSHWFTKLFAFDVGIDMTNDVDVLYRRNVVIKNIIALSNILFTLIFLGLSLFRDNVGDWLMTVVFFPLTFAINSILKRLINADRHDKTKLEVAMYVSAFYMFLSSMLVYIRLVTGEVYYQDGTGIRLFEAASYILIFYSLVVISLYQNKKVLRNSFLSLLAVITIIHFTVTYSALGSGYTFWQFFVGFVPTPAFADIVLRTIIFCVFYLVVYAIVAISEQLSQERRDELIKRRQVQNDFASIVKDLFSISFNLSPDALNQKEVNQVKTLSVALADKYHLADVQMKELLNFVAIQLEYQQIETLLTSDIKLDESNYEAVKAQTHLGALIAKRLQLTQKAQDIVRAVIEKADDQAFIESMNKIQPEVISQIILMANIYIIMRSVAPYKRPISHKETLKYIDEHISVFIDPKVKETFDRYADEFEKIYSDFK